MTWIAIIYQGTKRSLWKRFEKESLNELLEHLKGIPATRIVIYKQKPENVRETLSVSVRQKE